MRAQAIFGPVTILALWTILVLYLTGSRRVRATLNGQLPRDAFKLGESDAVPPEISVFNRNYMNLLEAPVLFYVVCISLFVTREVHTGLVILAWVYVLLRVMHSLVHLTTNRVSRRFYAHAASNLTLLVMWIWFLWRTF